MKTPTNEVVADAAMMRLLKEGCPLLLGTPGWLLHMAAFRKEDPYSLIDIVGPKPDPSDPMEFRDGGHLNAEYGYRMGYQFSWGSITEIHNEASTDIPVNVSFHFLPEKILERFPHPDMLNDVMHGLYGLHP